jgi:hypothetical protein
MLTDVVDAQSSTEQTVTQALGALQNILEYIGTIAVGEDCRAPPRVNW